MPNKKEQNKVSKIKEVKPVKPDLKITKIVSKDTKSYSLTLNSTIPTLLNAPELPKYKTNFTFVCGSATVRIRFIRMVPNSPNATHTSLSPNLNEYNGDSWDFDWEGWWDTQYTFKGVLEDTSSSPLIVVWGSYHTSPPIKDGSTLESNFDPHTNTG
jgi:hypothetical protein